MLNFLRKSLSNLIALALVAFTLLLFLIIVAVKDLPELESLEDYNPPLTTRIISRDGETIGEYYKEKRYLLDIDKIPDIIVKSFISAEDERFFQHKGLDFQGILRAAIANFRAGKIVQGGSTITQQTAKSILQDSARSFTRKFKEAILANRMENKLSKEEILYIYLNQIYLGHGAYGVEAASLTYFRKHVHLLSIAEVAILAGLAQAPSKYSPLFNPVAARNRQVYVLSRMLESGHINKKQFEAAMKEEVKLYKKANINNEIAPYYIEHVRQQIQGKYGQDLFYKDGLEVHVAAHSKLSLKAKNAVEENLISHSKRQGYKGPIESVGEDQTKFLAALDRTRSTLFRAKHEFFYLPIEDLETFEVSSWERFSYEKAMEEGLFSDDRELLEEGRKYHAIVYKITEDKKTAILLIGDVEAKLPIKHMRWARIRTEAEIEQKAPMQPIDFVSDSLKLGDLILVKALHIPKLKNAESVKNKSEEEKNRERVVVSLEQEPQAQSSLVSMEIKTGHVIAMVGGNDFNKSEYNRVLQAERQPGSSFKPLIYAAAIHKGFTPASILLDSPVVFEDQETEGLTWIPENYEKYNYGDTTLFMAIVKSRNVPTVKLLQKIGIPYFLDYVRGFGIKRNLKKDLSIALGSNSMTLMDLTKAYSLFSNNGRRVEPVYVLKIFNRKKEMIFEHLAIEHEEKVKEKWLSFYRNLAKEKFGEAFLVEMEKELKEKEALLEEAKNPEEELDFGRTLSGETDLIAQMKEEGKEEPKEPSAEDILRMDLARTLKNSLQAMDEKTAFVLGDLLRYVIKQGTAGRASALERELGGKTGTSNDFMDAWFIGFSPEIVTGVWSGHDTPKSLGRQETGSKAALPAWMEYMKEALSYYPEDEYKTPEGIVFVRINPEDGSLVKGGGTAYTKVAFIEGTEPSGSVQEKNKKKVKGYTLPKDSNDFFIKDF